MYSLYDRIKGLCEKKGIKVGAMCTEIGISRGIISDLRYGRKKALSTSNVKKIADYFGVSMEYLLGDEENPAILADSGANAMDENIMDLVQYLTPDQKELFLAQLKIVTDKK